MGISILMPIKNGLEFLPESLKSIKNQTYKEWELVIGLNGHTKNSIAFNSIVGYESEKVRIFNLHELKSKSDTLNELINYCRYDTVCLLDVDDKWRIDKLERQIELIKKYDVVGTYCQYFGDKTNHPVLPTGELFNFNFKVNPIINSSVMLHKKDCKWDSEWEGIEDFELWLRLMKQGKKFFNLNDVLTFHRIHKGSAFNSQNLSEKLKKLLNKYLI